MPVWLQDRRPPPPPPGQQGQMVQAMLNQIQAHIDSCRLLLNNIESHRQRCEQNGDPPGEVNHAISHSHGPDNGNFPRQQAYDQVQLTMNRLAGVVTALTNAMPGAAPFGLDHGGGGLGPLGVNPAVHASPAGPAPAGPKGNPGKGR